MSNMKMSQNVRLTIQVEFFFLIKRQKSDGNVRNSRQSLFGLSGDVPTGVKKLRVRVIQRPPSNTN